MATIEGWRMCRDDQRFVENLQRTGCASGRSRRRRSPMRFAGATAHRRRPYATKEDRRGRAVGRRRLHSEARREPAKQRDACCSARAGSITVYKPNGVHHDRHQRPASTTTVRAISEGHRCGGGAGQQLLQERRKGADEAALCSNSEIRWRRRMCLARLTPSPVMKV